MRHPITSADTDRFRGAIALRLGLQFEDAKLGFLEDVLRRRLEVAGEAPHVYVGRLETENRNSDEVGALSQELTVPETYFFRNNDQYRAFADVALPDRMRVQAAARRLRILSAGCASGEETYSLAVIAEAVIDPSWDVSILGVDVNPAMVSKARQARFSEWALRETTADVRQRWFRREGRDFVLNRAVQAAVRFEERNLVRDDPELWQPDSYDIIFFRNVLMYFTPENGQAVIARIGRALRAGGYLFMGHAESLRDLSNDFHLRHTHETFYYQLKAPLDRLIPLVAAVTPPRGPAPSVVAEVEDSTWFDTIRRAAERVEILTRSPTQPARPSAVSRATLAAPAWILESVLDLLREERFTEALETLEDLPPAAERDPGVLLLRAALLTQRGQLAEAEEACRRLLDIEESSAGAHYLLALCREGVRDLKGAENHYQLAIRLDSGFAMPHLHLGLLARRAGDRAGAQDELRQALLLLQREDRARVLLFGGGFSRETLIALCRTELTGSGGKA